MFCELPRRCPLVREIRGILNYLMKRVFCCLLISGYSQGYIVMTGWGIEEAENHSVLSTSCWSLFVPHYRSLKSNQSAERRPIINTLDYFF